MIKYSPKEQLFAAWIEELFFDLGQDQFVAEWLAQHFYGSHDQKEWPVFWYQATIATISRVIRKMEDDREKKLRVKKNFGHGRGKKAKYIIERKNPAAVKPPGQSPSEEVRDI